jgi:hypothetical protein
MMSKIIALFFAALIAFGLSLLIIPSIGITIGCLVSMIYLYVLLAIAVTDQPAQQTIRYFDTVGECMEYKNKIEPTIDKSYVRLDCVPVKAN